MTDYRENFYKVYQKSLGQCDLLDLKYFESRNVQFDKKWEKWLPVNKESAFLDIGCGSGDFVYYLSVRNYTNIAGVDLDGKNIKRGKDFGIENLHLMSVKEFLMDKQQRYDCISAFNFFEHLKKDEILATLQMIYSALRPGGLLLAITPNGLSPFSGTTRYWDFSHETGFTPSSWRQLARINDFKNFYFEEMGPEPKSIKGIIRFGFWQLLRIILVGISYVEVASPRDPSWVFTADMKIILEK